MPRPLTVCALAPSSLGTVGFLVSITSPELDASGFGLQFKSEHRDQVFSGYFVSLRCVDLFGQYLGLNLEPYKLNNHFCWLHPPVPLFGFRKKGEKKLIAAEFFCELAREPLGSMDARDCPQLHVRNHHFWFTIQNDPERLCQAEVG